MYFQCQKLPQDTHLVLSHDIEILLGKLQCLGQGTNYALAGYAVLENKRNGHSQLEDCCARPPESFYGVHTSTFAQWTTQTYINLPYLDFLPISAAQSIIVVHQPGKRPQMKFAVL